MVPATSKTAVFMARINVVSPCETRDSWTYPNRLLGIRW
jgi:hypothetical protein